MGDKPPRSITTDWLARVGAVGLRRPWGSVILALVVVLLSGLYAYDMPISTSRYKLVDEEHPFQAQLLAFFERFGYPDSLVLVVEGGDDGDRQQAVIRLSQRLEEQVPELEDRVLGRLEVDDVAEMMLLFRPDLLSSMKKELEAEPADVVEGGAPAWIGVVQNQLSAQLEGAAPSEEEGEAPSLKEREKQADEGLRNLAKALRALDAELSGGDARRELPGIEHGDLPAGVGVNERGYIVAEDGSYLVALFPTLPGAEGYQVKPLVDRIRQIRDETELPPGVSAKLTGLPALVADELVVLQRGLAQTSVATTVGILLLLLVAFRSFRYTILALLPLGVGVVMTIAATRGIYGGLNLITSSFVPVLLGIGIDFGVYVLSRYGEEVRAGADAVRATLGALAKAGPGMLMGAITTIMAFLMTKTIEFTAYSELGVITATGLGLMLLVTILLLPSLVHIFGRGKRIHSGELPGLDRLPAVIHKGRLALPITAFLLVAGSALFWNRIDFNARYFDFIPEDTESAYGLLRIETDKALSPVQAGAGADSVEKARELADKLRDLPSVGAVQTATDLLPKLDKEKLAELRAGFEAIEREPDFDKLRNRKRSTKEVASAVSELRDVLDEVGFAMRQGGRSTAALAEAKQAAKELSEQLAKMPDDAPELAKLERRVARIAERAWTTGKAVAERGHYVPADLPPVFEARFASKDGTALAVYATPSGNIWDNAFAERFVTEVRSVDPNMTGLAVTIYEHLRMIREGFTRASLLSAGLVLVILLIGFRRLHDALLAMLPVAMGVCWLLGVMGMFDIDFDVANVVALPLLLGIGVDAGAHLMHRWRQSADANGGVAKLDEIVRGTGAAVLLAALTTAIGFAALMTGDYGGMKTLGLAMTIGVLSCLVASLLVLPALLVALKKAR